MLGLEACHGGPFSCSRWLAQVRALSWGTGSSGKGFLARDTLGKRLEKQVRGQQQPYWGHEASLHKTHATLTRAERKGGAPDPRGSECSSPGPLCQESCNVRLFCQMSQVGAECILPRPGCLSHAVVVNRGDTGGEGSSARQAQQGSEQRWSTSLPKVLQESMMWGEHLPHTLIALSSDKGPQLPGVLIPIFKKHK